MRKTALMSAGGFSEKPEYKTVEDYELWIRLSACGNFYCIDDPLATIVLHEGNYSRKANIQMHALDIMKRYYLDSDIGINTNERRKAYIALYELETRCLQKNGFFFRSNIDWSKSDARTYFQSKDICDSVFGKIQNSELTGERYESCYISWGIWYTNF